MALAGILKLAAKEAFKKRMLANLARKSRGSGNWGHEGRPLDPKKAYNMWSVPKQWKEYRTKPVTSTGKSREDLVMKDYTGNLKQSRTAPDVSLERAHIEQSFLRPEGDALRESAVLLRDPKVQHFEPWFADLPREVDDYVKRGVNRKMSDLKIVSGGDEYRQPIFSHPDFITPKKYLSKVDFKEPGKKVFFGDQPSGFTTQSEGIITNVIRNQTYHQHYENRLLRWLTEKKLIQQAWREKKIPKEKMLKDLKTADSHIDDIKEDMTKLGLESAIWDEAKQSFRYFGKRYDNEFRDMLKDMKKSYKLKNPPYKISQGFDKSKKQYWMKPIGHNEGGLFTGYAAGGLVGIGSKILARLAKKLSEKELKMLMGSLWKGVDPKQSGRYKVWDKKRFGPGYKWPWQKSRIRGPGIKKSHYASLSDQAKEDLRKRYAKRLAEYIAKKKGE